ncbi:MAG: CoA transferase [Thermodesulfobacteriota bacterium]|jgi:crotonobetainyl-CoA:carnitine CoA-transferase CaiB-like acyl-CoA transferase
MTPALEGIKVIDLSQVAAVPMCARHLADFGADVIHIENLAGDSWRRYQDSQVKAMNGAPSEFNYMWEVYNRNKRSLTLNIAEENGRNVLSKLLSKADVFLTNLRGYELERFQLSYEDIKALNPRIIGGYLSGYGTKGPDKDSPAYDMTAYWERSGIAYAFSLPGVPVMGFRAGFGDNLAGLALAHGIMTALYVRERTGKGQEINVSLLHAGLYQLSYDIVGALNTGLDFADWRENPPQDILDQAQLAVMQIGLFYAGKAINPLAAVYSTKDGRFFLFLSLQPDRYWKRFCLAIGRQDLADDPKYQTEDDRAPYNLALRQTIGETFMTKTYDEWVPVLEGMPFAPIQSVKEAANDPQAQATGCFISYEHPRHGLVHNLASPINMSETPANYRMPAPELGQHTEEVLLEYGFGPEDIVRLKEQGIIV